MGFENDFALLLGRSVRNVPMKEVLLPIPTVESTNGNYQPSKYQRPIFFPPYSFIPINSLSSNYAFALATANSTRLRLFISRACDSLSLRQPIQPAFDLLSHSLHATLRAVVCPPAAPPLARGAAARVRADLPRRAAAVGGAAPALRLRRGRGQLLHRGGRIRE